MQHINGLPKDWEERVDRVHQLVSVIPHYNKVSCNLDTLPVRLSWFTSILTAFLSPGFKAIRIRLQRQGESWTKNSEIGEEFPAEVGGTMFVSRAFMILFDLLISGVKIWVFNK